MIVRALAVTLLLAGCFGSPKAEPSFVPLCDETSSSNYVVTGLPHRDAQATANLAAERGWKNITIYEEYHSRADISLGRYTVMADCPEAST